MVAAQDVTEEEEAADEDATDDVIAEDEDDEAEVEDDENTELVSIWDNMLVMSLLCLKLFDNIK